MTICHVKAPHGVPVVICDYLIKGIIPLRLCVNFIIYGQLLYIAAKVLHHTSTATQVLHHNDTPGISILKLCNVM